MRTAVRRWAHGVWRRFEISRITDASGALANALHAFGPAPFVMGSEFPLRDLREVRWTADRERLIF